MRHLPLIAESLVLTGAIVLLFSPPAHAYWDLNFGTYLIQMLFTVGAAMWISVKGFTMGRKKAPDKNVAGEADKSAAPTSADLR